MLLYAACRGDGRGHTVVCAAWGAYVPFVLRPVGGISISWLVVGEAYVKGIMHGELIRDMDQAWGESVKFKDFVSCRLRLEYRLLWRAWVGFLCRLGTRVPEESEQQKQHFYCLLNNLITRTFNTLKT
jgi:hypothetical protein